MSEKTAVKQNTEENNTVKSKVGILVELRLMTPLYEGAKKGLAPSKYDTGKYKTGSITEDIYKEYQTKDQRLEGITFKEFYKNRRLSIYKQVRVLDISDILDKLDYEWLKEHPYIAESIEEYNPTVHQYVLTNSEKVAAKSIAKMNNVYEAITIYKTLSPSQVRRIALWGYNINLMNTSDVLVEEKMFQLIEKDPDKFIRLHKDPNKELKTKIAEAVDLGILIKKGAAYFMGENVLGSNEDAVISFLMEPKNQEYKKTILSEIEAKRQTS
jgi:hypothetical protein